MATKTFDHAVIWNGELVPPNTPIEEKAETVAKTEKAEKPKKAGVKNDSTAD